MAEKIIVILLAGGTGSRMGAPVNKVLLPVAGVPCIVRSAQALAPFADAMVLVGRPEEEQALHAVMKEAGLFGRWRTEKFLCAQPALQSIAKKQSGDKPAPKKYRKEKKRSNCSAFFLLT